MGPDGFSDDGGEPYEPGDPDVYKLRSAASGQARGPLAVAVSTLNECDVTQVFETPEGYALFQLGERRAEHVISLEQAREDIRFKLLQDAPPPNEPLSSRSSATPSPRSSSSLGERRSTWGAPKWAILSFKSGRYGT